MRRGGINEQMAERGRRAHHILRMTFQQPQGYSGGEQGSHGRSSSSLIADHEVPVGARREPWWYLDPTKPQTA